MNTGISIAAATLPAAFQLPIVDDTMSPLLEIGGKARFATGRLPVQGRPVLFKDARGAAYIREYQPYKGRWKAVPLNPKYEQFDSERDGLEVLAVFTGYDLPEQDIDCEWFPGRWSDRAGVN